MKVIRGGFSENNKAGATPPEGTTYSSMLMTLVKPYVVGKIRPDELDEMIQLGIVAWNMSVLKTLEMPQFEKMFENTVNSAGINKKNASTIRQMMADKLQLFGEHKNLIETYTLEDENPASLRISVVTKTLFDFMGEVGEDEEDDFDDNEFDDDFVEDEFDEYDDEPGFINRAAITLTPKAAFWAWVKKANKGLTTLGRNFPTVYLVGEECFNEDSFDIYLEENFETIFDAELFRHIEDDNKWPKKRTYKMFREYFDVTLHDMVMDVEFGPISK